MGPSDVRRSAMRARPFLIRRDADDSRRPLVSPPPARHPPLSTPCTDLKRDKSRFDLFASWGGRGRFRCSVADGFRACGPSKLVKGCVCPARKGMRPPAQGRGRAGPFGRGAVSFLFPPRRASWRAGASSRPARASLPARACSQGLGSPAWAGSASGLPPLVRGQHPGKRPGSLPSGHRTPPLRRAAHLRRAPWRIPPPVRLPGFLGPYCPFLHFSGAGLSAGVVFAARRGRGRFYRTLVR